MEVSRNDILNNRQAVLDWLCSPNCKRITGKTTDGVGGYCPLGYAAKVANLPLADKLCDRKIPQYSMEDAATLLGLNNPNDIWRLNDISYRNASASNLAKAIDQVFEANPVPKNS